MIGLGTIPIFISMLLSPPETKEFFGININNFIQYFDPFENIIVSFSLFIILIYLLKSIFLLFSYLFELRILRNIRVILSERLLKIYMFKPYTFFVNKNSSELSKNVIQEADNAVSFLNAIINLSREFSILLIVFSLLIFFDPLISIGAFILLSFFGLLFFSSTNQYIKVTAETRFKAMGEVYKSLFLSFGAIKDVKIYKKENFFIKQFKKAKKIYEQSVLRKQLITKLPKIIFEFTGVALIISVTLFFIYIDRDVSELLPVLALIAVSTIRLMPSFSSISQSLSLIRYLKNSFDLLEEEIMEDNENTIANNSNKNGEKLKKIVETNKAIKIQNLNFAYPGDKNGMSIKNISLDITRGEMIGIIGKSGAGKSTLANIILKLLSPSSGEIDIYNTNFNLSSKKNNYKQTIAYIPQDIFLMDDTLRRNIAFGEYDEDIVNEKVLTSLKDAELMNFVRQNSQGLDLIVGERGIKLSGGEKQRIGIARALYRDPEILVMDEATSSLDTFTEQQIMNSINKLKKKHTIVMIAHRLSTVINCDKIYLIENGEIKDSGKLNELLKRHPYLDSYGNNKS